MSRPLRISLIALAALVFAAVAILVARVLGASTTARNDVIELVKLQSKGAERDTVARIEGCAEDPACSARIRAQVRRLGNPAKVRILRIDDVANLSIGSRTDTARVVWKAGERLPVVQCVEVRRAGNPFTGYDIRILSLSPPIGREEDC